MEFFAIMVVCAFMGWTIGKVMTLQDRLAELADEIEWLKEKE